VVDSGATVVIRPDSGDPATIVLDVATRLADTFGYTVNDKGYKVLNNVRIIQGDGINLESIVEILSFLTERGFSTDNVAFGMGGALLQAPQRDDQKFAMKCSAALINGEWVDVYKDPITDHGKRSKKGRLKLVTTQSNVGLSFHTIAETDAPAHEDILRPVFENGKLLVEDNFADVRARAEVK
jgi:nicotinamide phosphoribosyltransferase